MICFTSPVRNEVNKKHWDFGRGSLMKRVSPKESCLLSSSYAGTSTALAAPDGISLHHFYTFLATDHISYSFD